MYRILIVDDEKNERDCILYLLKNCGFELEIKEAEDGVEALQILKIWPAHILFTDVQMPRMDGLELIREALNLYPDIRPIRLCRFCLCQNCHITWCGKLYFKACCARRVY